MTKKYEWLNNDSRTFLSRGYLTEGVTPEQRIIDIAQAAEKNLGIEGFAAKFEDYMSRGFYSLSSPIWSNFGLERGLPISCYGSYIPDDMEHILTKMGEIGTMSKVGGGTSAYFGAVRGRGSAISSGGQSTGVHHQLTVFNSLINYVSQGNVRRGSFAAYLPIDHADIEEFLKIRSEGNAIQELSIGVCISDDWMKSMIEGDKDKRKLWGKVIQKRFESGYPYIFFSDTANKNAPQVYKDKGKRIHASNLCLVGDTIVNILVNDEEYLDVPLEDLGYYQHKFGSIKVKSFDVDTKEVVYEEVLAFAQTGESEELIEIEDEKGNIIQCTPEHQIYTQNRGYVQAQTLTEDDDILQGVNGELVASRVQRTFTDRVSVYDITVKRTKNFFANNLLVHNCSEIFLSTFDDESFVCNLSSINLDKWRELRDTDAIKVLIYFLDAVMTEFISKTEGVKYMEAPHKFAVNQRALGLGVLGWHSYLQQHNIAFESMEAKMENSSIFETIRQQCDEATQELAAKFGEPPLLEGYGKRNVTTMAVAPTTSCTTADTKFQLEDGSCVDYFEYCKLGGLNLSDIIDSNKENTWYDLETPVSVQTVDGVKTSKRFYFNGYRNVLRLTFSDGSEMNFTANHKLKMKDGEWVEVGNMVVGIEFNNGITLNSIVDAGIQPTMDMEVDDVHQYILENGIHSHNSSFILGQVSPSIEPLNSNYFVKDLAKGKFTYKNNYLKKLLKEKGKDDNDTWKSILLKAGSVQHLDFLSSHEKDVFKTFGEISQKEIVIQAAQRQKYIDQGQSLNLMIAPSVRAKDVNELMIFAWEQGIKSLYYQRSANPAQELARSILECSTCQS